MLKKPLIFATKADKGFFIHLDFRLFDFLVLGNLEEGCLRIHLIKELILESACNKRNRIKTNG